MTPFDSSVSSASGSSRWRRIVRTALTSTAAVALGLALHWPPALAARDSPQGIPGEPSRPSTAPTPGHLADCAERVFDRLFFGLGTPDGRVSDSAWARFLTETVTPRFPNGLTVLHASGQWRALGEPEVTVERSRVVEIAHDGSPEMNRHIGEVIAIYKHRHHQRSVMLTRARVEVCL